MAAAIQPGRTAGGSRQNGTPFDKSCPGNAYITKFHGGAGNYADSIGAVCSDGTDLGTYGGSGGGGPDAWSAKGPFTSVNMNAGWWLDNILGHGGSGGSPYQSTCPQGQVVTGFLGSANPGTYVDSFGIKCGPYVQQVAAVTTAPIASVTTAPTPVPANTVVPAGTPIVVPAGSAVTVPAAASSATADASSGSITDWFYDDVLDPAGKPLMDPVTKLPQKSLNMLKVIILLVVIAAGVYFATKPKPQPAMMMMAQPQMQMQPGSPYM